MNTASLFADPNLLQLESEAMINTDDAPSQRSADATAPFAPKARENPVHRAKIKILSFLRCQRRNQSGRGFHATFILSFAKTPSAF
jgi:hypothetical protein